MNPRLSIIVPAYNEAKRIGSTLDAILAYVARQPYMCEIIVVDDGSSDATAETVKKRMTSNPALSLTRSPRNKGKGAAVKAGMLAAKGELRLFTDADNSTSIEQLDKLLPFMREGYDIVIGSRQVAGAVIAVRQSVIREILGATFRLLAHTLVPVGVRDTQNGFKLFSEKAVRHLFGSATTDGWSFDVEILLLARKVGYRIKEVPIVWTNDTRSRMRFMQMVRMLVDLVRLSWRSHPVAPPDHDPVDAPVPMAARQPHRSPRR